MRSSLRRVLPAVLAALALGAVGASSALADNYVALGDSYSSGTGTRDYSFDATCQRGPYAYPALISVDRPNTTLTFKACSGAKTGDVLANQVQALSTSTNIVTITIGGNDAGFANVITKCAEPWPVSCDGDITNAQTYISNTLPGKLDSVYSNISSRAPNATVVVLGYPRLFMGVDCNALTFFSSSEMTRLNQTADLLASVTKARAQAHGFWFKDAIPPFTGHAVCSSSEWLNGLSNPISDSYHPNRSGHKLGYEPLVRAVIG
jgi:lysophospholipase L1-like esterase